MDEREELGKMTVKELAAYWNILTMGLRMVRNDPEKLDRHLVLVKELLAGHGVTARDGQRLIICDEPD